MVVNYCVLLFPSLVVSYIKYPWGTKEHMLCAVLFRRLLIFLPEEGRMPRSLGRVSRAPLTKIGMDGEGKLLFINFSSFSYSVVRS